MLDKGQPPNARDPRPDLVLVNAVLYKELASGTSTDPQLLDLQCPSHGPEPRAARSVRFLPSRLGSVRFGRHSTNPGTPVAWWLNTTEKAGTQDRGPRFFASWP